MIYLYLFGGVVLASVVMGSLVGLAGRERQRCSVDSGPVMEPVRHTEAEREALWAELAPADVDTVGLALARAEAYTASVLDGLERTVARRMHALWTLARAGLDDIDAEWAALSTGEHLAVA